jgi:hypothetical protein
VASVEVVAVDGLIDAKPAVITFQRQTEHARQVLAHLLRTDDS